MKNAEIKKHNAQVIKEALATILKGSDNDVQAWEDYGLAFGLCLRVIDNNFIPLVYDEYVGSNPSSIPEGKIYHDCWLFTVWQPLKEGDCPTKGVAYYAMYKDGSKVYRINQRSRMWNYNWSHKEDLKAATAQPEATEAQPVESTEAQPEATEEEHKNTSGLTCYCCGADITVPQFNKGHAYGWSCIKKVAPKQKRTKDAGLWLKADRVWVEAVEKGSLRQQIKASIGGVTFAVWFYANPKIYAETGEYVPSYSSVGITLDGYIRFAKFANGSGNIFKHVRIDQKRDGNRNLYPTKITHTKTGTVLWEGAQH